MARDSELRTHAKHVIHEGATTGADLDELNGPARSALGHPFGNEPNADKLTKDLGDLGGGYKVALEAELVAAILNSARVVSAYVGCQTHAHEASQRHRTCGLDGIRLRLIAFPLSSTDDTHRNGISQLLGQGC